MRYSSNPFGTPMSKGLDVQHHAPVTLPPGKSQYALYMGLSRRAVGVDGLEKFRPQGDSLRGHFTP
jgi:hypothetical protein